MSQRDAFEQFSAWLTRQRELESSALRCEIALLKMWLEKK